MEQNKIPFITNRDYEEFSKNDENLDGSIELFLLEIREYFNTEWIEEYNIKNELKSLDELNHNHLEDYPSTAGHHILDDSFTGPLCPVDILSSTSKTVLGYFYGIHLR
jgi:hypothetical protein